jgi:hypothetical protein
MIRRVRLRSPLEDAKKPAYALDATYRVMAKTMGGAPQKLPRAG